MPRSSARLGHRVAGGFTLVELLVVIGIITVLIAILLPAIRNVRLASINTVCATRLHQIVQACSIYLVDYKRYPQNYTNDQPPTRHRMVFPHDQQSRMMNQLSTYLTKFPLITDATSVAQLPAVLQCPWAEMSEVDDFHRRKIGNGDTYWYTGYAYYAQLEENPNYVDTAAPYTVHPQIGVVLKPNRHADRKGRRRGVLYGDNVVYFGPNQMWNFTHHRWGPVAAPAGWGFWRKDTRPFHGRHLAWSDGSIEWINGIEIKLDLKFANENASYANPAKDYLWWY